MAAFDGIEKTVGNTPLLKLSKIGKKLGLRADIYAKLEYFNPAGSVKDRVAAAMLADAEGRGILKKGGCVIEPTSGNTGVALAAMCAAKGYKCVVVMPENMSEERKKLISAYGAELVLTQKNLGMAGAIARADCLKSAIPNAVILGQFTNPANAAAHFNGTAPEIWRDICGAIDIFVAGVGTGGTLAGCSRYFKSRRADIAVYAVEPSNSAVLSGGKADLHGIQGIGAGFIPELLVNAAYDGVCAVSDKDAYDAAMLLRYTEGAFAGISSGANLHAAIALAKDERFFGKNIVTVFPDGGERYLSLI